MINKRLIASMGCAALLLSSISVTSYAASARNFTTVDVVSAASTVVAPTAKPAAKPATKSTTKATTKATTTSNFDATNGKVTRFLALNSVGNDVKLVQTWLNNNGHVLKVDGIYGNLTLNAVKSYQGKNGLRADGIIGPKTLAKLAPVVEAVKPVEPTTPLEPSKPVEPAKPVEEEKEVDVVTSASIVDNAAAFEKAIAKDGTWIICTLNDLVIDKDLVLDGDMKNGKKNEDGTDAIQRKIALYTQDADKNVTGEFTLTAPKLTINSANARIQNGTFKGDLYVTVPGFQLVGTKIEGNIYFTTQEAKDSFKLDEKSSVSGVQELKVAEVDVITSASIVNNEVAFEKAISKEGAWIAGALNDLTFDKTLILDGEFTNKDLTSRKIALYEQDENRVTTAKFTLTAPKLIIISPEASIQKGTFKGDIHVTVPNFKLVDAIVEGNVYFTTKAAMDSFKMDDTSSITGKIELLEVDVVTSASLVNNEAAFEKGIAKDGTWIISTVKDLTFNKGLVLEGEFKNGKKNEDGTDAIQRKIALYTQDENKIVTSRFTLTAPKLTVTSPKARIQGGTFKGDVYVSVANFQLVDAKVDGNIYFTTQEAKDSFKLDAKSSVTGVQELEVK